MTALDCGVPCCLNCHSLTSSSKYTCSWSQVSWSTRITDVNTSALLKVGQSAETATYSRKDVLRQYHSRRAVSPLPKLVLAFLFVRGVQLKKFSALVPETLHAGVLWHPAAVKSQLRVHFGGKNFAMCLSVDFGCLESNSAHMSCSSTGKDAQW